MHATKLLAGIAVALAATVGARSWAAEEALAKAEALYLQKLYVQAIEAAQEAIQEHPGDVEIAARAKTT